MQVLNIGAQKKKTNENKSDHVNIVSGKDKKGGKCPECGKKMRQVEGCSACPSCGFSYCSA